MKRVQRRARDTGDRILAVSQRLFRAQGFDRTSVDQIAEAADVAKGTVFAHFGDKTNLLAAVGMRELSSLVDDAKARAAGGAKRSPVDDVVGLYKPWLAFFDREPAFAVLFLNQAGLTEGAWTEQFARACGDLENAVAELCADWRDRGALDGRGTPGFLAEGAQAFFYNAVVYRTSGRVADVRAQLASLKSFLGAWLG